eukprot:GHVL01032586.1.p1 GENE.GHVL01032586.1~~GHVL01032586.1.p1  ORF type:complete len:169 (+),score=13.21 GHVL01032586.1:107-613(+)
MCFLFYSAVGRKVEDGRKTRQTLTPAIVKVEREDSSESQQMDDDLPVWPASAAIADLTMGCAELAPTEAHSGEGRGVDFLRISTFGDLSGASPVSGGEKRFRCPKCGAAYAQSGSLGRHRRKCEGFFALVCKFCGQLFHRKDRYREHLLSKHEYIDPDLGPPGYTLSK